MPEPEPEPAIVPPKGKGKESATGASALLADTTPLITQEARLYLWMGEEFENQGIVQAQIAQRTGTYDFFMVALVDGDAVLCHQINSGMNPRNTAHMSALTWNHIPFAGDGDFSSWLFQFEAPEAYDAFTKAFTKALWETLHKSPWQKAKARTRGW